MAEKKQQWVNLPREDDFVDADTKEKKRLDYVQFKVTFKKAMLSGYRLTWAPIGGDKFEKYEQKESRNTNFTVRGMPGVNTNPNDKKEMVCTYKLYLNAAGGNEYEIKAKHKGKVVTSTLKLESRRKLWYQVMKMKGIKAASTEDLEKALWDESNKLFVKLEKKGPESTNKFISCLEDTKHMEFIKSSAKGYKLKDLKPYSFGISFVNYIADPVERKIKRPHKFTIPSKITKLLSNTDEKVEVSIDIGVDLWFDLDKKDDIKKRWFKDIQIWFEPDSNPDDYTILAADESNVDADPGGTDSGSLGGCRNLKFTFSYDKVAKNFFTQQKGTFYFYMELLVPDGFTCGFAYNEINLVAIATKMDWEPNKEFTSTLIHEVGHMIGMVADGLSAVSPNSHQYLYGQYRDGPKKNNQGHEGPHCSVGATWLGVDDDDDNWSGKPGCVMFGADATSSPNSQAPATFCPDCLKILRKLDLSADALKLGAFKNSMEEL